MTFTTVMTILCVAYVLIYAGMVLYDMFLAHDAIDITPKIEEEEIDISDEALSFRPTEIDKDAYKWEGAEKGTPQSHDQTKMTNGIEVDKLVPMMDDLAELGGNSPLGGMIRDWSEHDMAA